MEHGEPEWEEKAADEGEDQANDTTIDQAIDWTQVAKLLAGSTSAERDEERNDRGEYDGGGTQEISGADIKGVDVVVGRLEGLIEDPVHLRSYGAIDLFQKLGTELVLEDTFGFLDQSWKNRLDETEGDCRPPCAVVDNADCRLGIIRGVTLHEGLKEVLSCVLVDNYTAPVSPAN